jgi:hypothetical protein
MEKRHREYNPPKEISHTKKLLTKLFSVFKKNIYTPHNNNIFLKYTKEKEIFSLLDDDMKNVTQAIKHIIAKETKNHIENIYPETKLIEDL